VKYSTTYTNKFEAGHVDIFTVDAIDVGTVEKVLLGHDNAGVFGSAWYVESLELTNYSSNENVFFPCDKWFDKKTDDKKLERELIPVVINFGETRLKDDAPVATDQKKEASSTPSQTSANNNATTAATPTSQAGKGGKLTLQLLNGQNLAAKDSNGFSDPYCEFCLLDGKGNKIVQSKKTSKVIKKSLNPEWNEMFQFVVDQNVAAIEVTCWDEDLIGSHDFLGMFKMSAADMVNKKGENTFTLEKRPGKPDEEVKGTIKMKMIFEANK